MRKTVHFASVMMVLLLVAIFGWSQSNQPGQPAQPVQPASVQPVEAAPAVEAPAAASIAPAPAPSMADPMENAPAPRGGYGGGYGARSSGGRGGYGGGMGMGGMGMGMGGMGGGMMMGSGSNEKQVVRFFDLQNRPASEVREILAPLIMDQSVVLQEDSRTGRLIVVASEETIKHIEELLKQVDVPISQSKAKGANLNVTFQVFAVEANIPGGRDEEGIPFTLETIVSTDDQQMFNEFITKIDGASVKTVDAKETEMSNEKLFTVQGTVQSEDHFQEMIQNLTNNLPNVEIRKRSMDSSRQIQTYQVPEGIELPEKVKSLMNRFLGQDTKIVAYWFGNSNVPGHSMAQLGDFILEINSEPPIENSFSISVALKKVPSSNLLGTTEWNMPEWNFDQKFEFSGDFNKQMDQQMQQLQQLQTLNEERELSKQDRERMDQSRAQLDQLQTLMDQQREQWKSLQKGKKPSGSPDIAKMNWVGSPQERQSILENSVTCRIGQPIVIGYTRQADNLTRQGALILVPESDSVETSVQTTGFLTPSQEAGVNVNQNDPASTGSSY